MARLRVPVPVRWGDLDAYGHVNNVAVFRLLEEARVHAFWGSGDGGAPTAVIDRWPDTDTVTLVGRQEIEYLAPIPYGPAPLDVQLWLGRLSGASLTVCYEVCSPAAAAPAVLYARAETTIVLVDAPSGRPRRITDAERAAWTPYLDAPVRFAKRGPRTG